MTVQYLTFTGGQYGLLVENNSNNLTANFLTFSANSVDGLLVENSPAVSLQEFHGVAQRPDRHSRDFRFQRVGHEQHYGLRQWHLRPLR